MLHYESYVLNPENDWVVFLHGLGGNSEIWYRQKEDFGKHFNLLFIDLRGHGGSANYTPKTLYYTPEEISKDILKVLDFLHIKKAHFAGISLGTIIMHALHIHAPSRIKSMVLGGAIIRFTPAANLLLKAGDMIKSKVPYMWLYKLFAFILMPRAHHKKSRDIFIREAKKISQEEFIKWYRVVAMSWDIYPKVDTAKHVIPKLYIMGEQDYVFVSSIKKDTAKDSSAAVHIIKKCGHVCNIEKHLEFNEVALKFFTERSTSRALVEKRTKESGILKVLKEVPQA